jgi:hypothetical protein
MVVDSPEGRIDRGLWWSDAAFYGALASTAAFVALINLYAREAKWWDPKTLSGLRPLAVLRHAGYKHLWQVTASFLIDFPFLAVAAVAAQGEVCSASSTVCFPGRDVLPVAPARARTAAVHLQQIPRSSELRLADRPVRRPGSIAVGMAPASSIYTNHWSQGAANYRRGRLLAGTRRV